MPAAAPATTDIAVAGGGAVALAFALAAKQRGFGARVFADGAPPAERFFALNRRSLNFLRGLGITTGAGGLPVAPAKKFFLFASNGKRAPLASAAPLCCIVKEAALLQRLQEQAQAAGVATQAARLQWEKTEDDAVFLRAAGAPIKAKFLAAADGGRGGVARQIGVFGNAHFFDQHAVTARVFAPSMPQDAAAQWFGANNTLALLPLGGGEFSLIWSTAAPPEDKDLQAAARQRANMADLQLAEGAPIARFPLVAARRALAIAQRAAFLGDSLCALHPLAGQGLNVGLRNAQALALCLRRQDAGAAAGLLAYNAVAFDRAAPLARLTRLLAKSDAAGNAAVAAAALPPVARDATLVANI